MFSAFCSNPSAIHRFHINKFISAITLHHLYIYLERKHTHINTRRQLHILESKSEPNREKIHTRIYKLINIPKKKLKKKKYEHFGR